MKRSLRFRLLVGASLGSIVVFSLLAISLYVAMRHALMQDFDASLTTAAHVAAGMTEQDEGKVTLEYDPQQLPDFVSDKSGKYFEIWLDDGSVLARSASLGDRDLDASITPSREITLNFTPKSEDHEGETPAPPGRIRTARIVVAGEPTDVLHTLRLLGWLLIIFCAAAVLVLAMVLVRVVNRGVRPVMELAREIDLLKETDLHRRFARDGVPNELSPVVDKLNGLLARLEEAFGREKAFTADVAHELRTPLAGLRTAMEVSLSRPRNAEEYESVLTDCREITGRMEAMVQSLLLLARFDSGQLTIERQRVNLDELMAETWSLFQSRTAARVLRVELDLEKDCSIETDADKIRIVLQNLLDNAVSYADDGGRIRIAVHRNDRGAVVEIANTGSKIAARDVQRVFHRFWRGDAARSDAGVHCGLGLSLCERLTKLLGGDISIHTEPGAEFIVRLRLP